MTDPSTWLRALMGLTICRPTSRATHACSTVSFTLLIDPGLHDLGEVTPMGIIEGDPKAAASRQRSPPAGLLCDQPQHALGSRDIQAWHLARSIAVLDRRQLSVLAKQRPPVIRGDPFSQQMPIRREKTGTRSRVRWIPVPASGRPECPTALPSAPAPGLALRGPGIQCRPFRRHRRVLHQAQRCKVILESDNPIIGVQACLEVMESDRTVEIMVHVVRPRPREA